MDESGPKPIRERLLGFIEQPLFLACVELVGGIVGFLLYAPVFIVSGICVLLAFHRAKVVAGEPVWLQLLAYAFLCAIVVGILWGLHVQIARKLAEANTSLSQLVGKVVVKLLRTEPSPQQRPAEQQTAEAPVAKPIETANPPKQEQLFVDCYSIQGHATFPSEGVARILDLQETPESVMKTDYLEETTGKAGADFAGKDINNFPINVAECHITSYISGPMFNITATLRVIFKEAVQKSANASESGNVTLTRDWPIKIPKIDYSPDHAFVFYVMNESNRFVSLSFPDKVMAQVPGKTKRQSLQLIKWRELPLMFSPIK